MFKNKIFDLKIKIKKPWKRWIFKAFGLFTTFFRLVPAVGLEPTRGYPQQILSLHRLPFRHAGLSFEQNVYYHKKYGNASIFLKKFKKFEKK